MPRIGFAGMTHLGLNSALAAAEKGVSVVCYDADAARIAALGRRQLPVVEPGLPELLEKNAARITFTADVAKLGSCDVVYVAPDVATDDDGGSDLSQINSIIGDVEPALRADAAMVVLSQVPPGFTRALQRDKAQLFYQVETLIFGRAVERALYPERFIVGCADPEKPLPDSLSGFLGRFGCPILPMLYESAELAKISINMCLVGSVTVANTLAEVCEHVGAIWSEIVPALRLDKRIGPHSYLNPGLGIAGGNLERDLATVLRLAERHGTDATLVSAFIANSRHRSHWARRTLDELVLRGNPRARIAVLGLTYKEDTHSLKNSPSIALLETLAGFTVAAFDPVAAQGAQGSGVARAPSALDAVNGADVVVIMTPWAEFRAITPADLAARMRQRNVIDPYRVMDGAQLSAMGFAYATLGAPARLAGAA